MNKQESDILRSIAEEPFLNQRVLAETSGHSLGVVNKSLKNLTEQGYLDEEFHLTSRAEKELEKKAPRRAIILAAGFGMRMVPINLEFPKALLQIDGEVLIERQIRQLHEAGIREIYVVVGFMKEQFEYLIDEFGVKLVVNPEYSVKNNLHSLKLVRENLDNAYVIPCDIWCDRNPFSSRELYSWYMVSDLIDEESEVRVNRKMELVRVGKTDCGNTMVGICYLLAEDAAAVKARIAELCGNPENDQKFWEEALYDGDRMTVAAQLVHSTQAVEINTYEQLRELDEESEQLKSRAIQTVTEALSVSGNEIRDIRVLKKGMTNRSFLFSARDRKYIMRIPGEGTGQLISRKEEAAVYQAIRSAELSDEIVFINPENGYKITRYLENARTCDSLNWEEVGKCMALLKRFHGMKLEVGHSFDLFAKLEFYESLWQGRPSVYRDYQQTKENVLSLRKYVEEHAETRTLTHIDAVPDNFLFTANASGEEEVRLIDWEYAGMQDPHVDIAMFCVYALYDREQCDRLIDLYFAGECPAETRIKIYCYIALCGLLWSNWCEYKQHLGVEFGEYSLRQYRYAKDFYRLAFSAMEK